MRIIKALFGSWVTVNEEMYLVFGQFYMRRHC